MIIDTFKYLPKIIILSLIIFFGCSQNYEPIIKSIVANPNPVQAGNIVNLSCDAIDDDDENIFKNELLKYEWFAPYGELTPIIGTNTATWKSPEEAGKYSISCSVTDQYNGLDILAISITVQ